MKRLVNALPWAAFFHPAGSATIASLMVRANAVSGRQRPTPA